MFILCFLVLLLLSCSNDPSNNGGTVALNNIVIEETYCPVIFEEPTQQNESQIIHAAINGHMERVFIENIDIREGIYNFTEIRDVHFWNDSMQTALYIFFLENDNLTAALEFRAFLEALDREMLEAARGEPFILSSRNFPPRLVNPVIVLIDNSHWGGRPFTNTAMDFFAAIYEKRPDLFFQGNRGSWDHSGDVFSRLPLIHAVQNGHSQFIRFFVENVGDWQEMRSLNSWSFGQMIEWDIGLGGNLLSYLPEMLWDNRRTHNFLVEHGIKEYSNITIPIFVDRRLDETNVWSEPSVNSKVIRRISREERLQPIKITTYSVDGSRWVHFEMEDGVRGWAPFLRNIRYESGR